MANVNFTQTWKVELTTEEFRLVVKALGRRLKDEDYGPADELGTRLQELRIAAVEHLGREMGKLSRNLLDAKKGTLA